MSNIKFVKIKNENDQFQLFETLKTNRNKRHRLRKFFVEGVRNIDAAIENNWTIDSFVVIDKPRLTQWAQEKLNYNKVKKNFSVPYELMKKLSEKDDPSELIAIIDMNLDHINQLTFDTMPLITVFDRPSNKGNLGTIIRTCDALNSQILVITGHSVDPYDPKTIVASMGSFFTVPIICLPSHKELLVWVKKIQTTYENLQVVGSSARGQIDLYQVNFTKPTVILIGNETYGLSQNYKNISDCICKIPMYGSASSLNVACANSVILYEANRQREIKKHN